MANKKETDFETRSDDEEEEKIRLQRPSGEASSRSLRLRLSRPQSEEEDDDYGNGGEEEELKKTIMIGSSYQATIPEGLCKYDDALPYENDDKLLWNPDKLTDEDIESYLVKAQEPIFSNAQGVHAIPTGAHTRDDEQALYLLLQCGYNVDEALRRRRLNAIPTSDTSSLWSEEECRNFENGLRAFGKDFHQIHQDKVRTRSVGELVQFYYLWKKTERHDIFANKARLEKKKYTLHPGITDYMDRFLEEQESGISSEQRDRSASPNHSLSASDSKRKQHIEDKKESALAKESTSGSVEITVTKTTSSTVSPSKVAVPSASATITQ
ncbi:mesoderm induction early response protein 1-like [Macrosteles quadrilineatus]|uniref:mesoderm induction early response protein 1-like n=1 Tax=Macrosteles quadrilineatus TaxID=74068 RepID=UPI0023E158EC|nr:mesoderm induction early response protein 1-like [Macrosteles quadrilineatus]